MKYIGGILFIACACLAAYIYFSYNIAVDVVKGEPMVSDAGQIVNIDLAVHKILYIIFCCTGMVIGAVVAMTGGETINIDLNE